MIGLVQNHWMLSRCRDSNLVPQFQSRQLWAGRNSHPLSNKTLFTYIGVAKTCFLGITMANDMFSPVGVL